MEAVNLKCIMPISTELAIIIIERVRGARRKRKNPDEAFKRPDQPPGASDNNPVQAPGNKAGVFARPKSEDHYSYKLNPLMSRMIDVELQDVMIKVWQSLPDEPKTDAEKLVAEKFRTDVGDNLRSVLGLNIAKRLLNIFNKLTLKIQFSVMPARANLRNFLKKYSFVSFKRVEGNNKTFLAQVKDIQDFDRLCNTKELYCGLSKLDVFPYYRFTQRPDKLKTTFNKSSIETPKTEDAIEKDKETLKPVNAVKQPETKEEANVPATTVAKTTQSNTQVKQTTTNTQPKLAPVKPNIQITAKPTQTAKEGNSNEPVNTPAKTNVSANTTTNPNTQVNITTPNKPATNTQKKTNTPAAIDNKSNTQVKPNASPAQNKTAQSTPTQTKTNTNQVKPTTPKDQKPAQVKPMTKAKVTPTKPQETKKKSPNVKTKKNPLEGKGDFEELDDHDILALMSGGIVLDECSGSDEE